MGVRALPIPHLRRLLRALRREIARAHVLNGAEVALGMLLVAAAVYLALGRPAAVNASVGALIALIPDSVQPRRGKFSHLLVAPVIGIPLFLAVQLLRGQPLELGLFLVLATFIAFLATAWGRRGLGVTVAVMFAALLALAPPPAADAATAALRTLWCALGALLYVLYATGANRLLNQRYRAQTLASLLATLAALLRDQARRLETGSERVPQQLARHAALAEQMQLARDLILERPNTRRRQQLAGLLMVAMEIRDRLIAGGLEWEHLTGDPSGVLPRLGAVLHELAGAVEQVADGLLFRRLPAAAHDSMHTLAALRAQLQTRAGHDEHGGHSAEWQQQAALLDSIATRLQDQSAAVADLVALARGERAPRLSAVRAGWQLFVSPAYWSPYPLLRLWHWRAPALRHALRAALAVGLGYTLAHFIPWGSRDYWVLITIVVVLRGDYGQTLARIHIAIIGTLIGSSLAALLLALQPPAAALLAVVVLSQGLTHAYVVRRYLVTAICGAILGLTLSYLLQAATTPVFDFIERVGDALLGAAIAWACSYVFPNWERARIDRLVLRVCRALARHARQSLALATLDEIGGQPELTWRLARREAYDALGALVQAVGRAQAEPRAFRPPMAPLQQLQARSFQLLGQLSAVQSLLLLRRQHLAPAGLAERIAAASQRICQTLDLSQPPPAPAAAAADNAAIPLLAIPEDLPDPQVPDPTPWLLRRIARATHHAEEVRTAALALRAQIAARAPAPPAGPGSATELPS